VPERVERRRLATLPPLAAEVAEAVLSPPRLPAVAAAGVPLAVAAAQTALPVTIVDTSCQILHLDLGAISLDVLGLQINLSRVILDITAQAGAGNLLGNLLCAVANLLNNPNPLARLLNSILELIS